MAARAFEMFLNAARRRLTAEHGRDVADSVITGARACYPAVAADAPDIGGVRNVFGGVIEANVWIISLHKAMRDQGFDAADSVRVCQQVFDGWFQKMPTWLLGAIGRLALSRPSRWLFDKQARRSQRREYPADFVWTVQQRAGGEFALVFDECAVNKWYERAGVTELAPYCNVFDVTYSRLMGMGIDASESIGQGCDHCELRYVHGRETVVPANLSGVIE